MKQDSLSVIIPCLNEEEIISDCIKAIPKMPWTTEIIVVDDGSTDKTVEVVKELNRKDVRIVSYKPNRGKGYAFRQGMKAAKGDVVVIQDADMNPKELPEIVKPIFEDKADFVNGTRLVYEMEKGAMKPLHVPGNKAFALIVSMFIGQKLTDALCGYKAFKRKVLSGQLKDDSWPDFELLLKAKRNHMRIVEVPIHYNARKGGESKMKTFSHGWSMLSKLIKAVLFD